MSSPSHVLLKGSSLIIALSAFANTVSVFLIWKQPAIAQTNSYEGTDYPEVWSLSPTPPIALVIEESVHYQITAPEAREEWSTTNPSGFGLVRLGPEKRVFTVSMTHQLHCLRVIRAGLAGDYSPETLGHFTHCLNKLRQMILCTPNLTLEPADMLQRDLSVERAGAIHVCADWRQVYSMMDENFAEWVSTRTTLPDI